MPPLQINNLTITSTPHPARIKFPVPSMLHITPDISLESRAAAPACYRAADCSPRTYYDVDAAVDVGVLGLGVCC